MIAELYKDFYDQLLWFCLNLSNNNRPLAEDIVQETFMRALEKAHVLNGLKKVQCRAWLYKTAKNVFIDWMRRAAVKPEKHLYYSVEDDLSEVMVRMLCNELPAQEAALFWLRHMEGYNSTELGEMFNLAPSTVRTKLACARGRLVKLYFESIRKGEY
ncbi:MAG: RNA polymerase sigma factor [Bacillota bacterium]|nr:RNA polymerase sigma factor [Bacillota bacterium]HHU30561.1 RNA polymerase sigma factor [Bacillota bacterium]